MDYDLATAAFLLDEELEKQWVTSDAETEEAEDEEGAYRGGYSLD